MKIKRFLSLVVAVVLVVSLAACGGGSKKVANPKTIMDLFDGKEKLWYYIDYRDSFDGLAYDCDVKAVFTTENKAVTSMYYNLIGICNNSLTWNSSMVGKTTLEDPNPFTCDRLLLSDFKGLSNKDVINKVSEVYANASNSYEFQYMGNRLYEKCDFPSDILYYGFLDNSGNILEDENIRLFDCNYCIEFSFNGSMEEERLRGEFYYDSTITPVEILDKQYIGIKDGRGNMIITENIYESFGNLAFDDPAGITEW